MKRLPQSAWKCLQQMVGQNYTVARRPREPRADHLVIPALIFGGMGLVLGLVLFVTVLFLKRGRCCFCIKGTGAAASAGKENEEDGGKLSSG